LSWTEIETQTLTTTAASVVFSTGLSGYKFFRLTIYIVNDANSKDVLLRLNNDSGTNYAYQTILGNGGTIIGGRATGQTSSSLTILDLGVSQAGSVSVLIAKPAAGVKAQVLSQSGVNTSPSLLLAGDEWDNTADLISRIDVIASSNNFAAGTSILLEGLEF
jgi:hypothetical protein